MSAHTKEPWSAKFEGAITVRDVADNQLAICTHMNTRTGGRKDANEVEANARRIAACVNACAGISTALLEQGSRPAMSAAYLSVKAQRNELLEALQNLVDGLDKTNWSSWQTTAYFSDHLEAARTEIAKAEAA
jgi:hypothetical protein